jgi:hypothetical protein
LMEKSAILAMRSCLGRNFPSISCGAIGEYTAPTTDQATSNQRR